MVVGHRDPGGIDDEAGASSGNIDLQSDFRINEGALGLDLHDGTFYLLERGHRPRFLVWGRTSLKLGVGLFGLPDGRFRAGALASQIAGQRRKREQAEGKADT